ncbi:MAG TPA: hypothetical protein VNK43_11525 [Gemmatimonadales bacterium]|nr:hypothetical protein [Gemmatimonadales bacterium]
MRRFAAAAPSVTLPLGLAALLAWAPAAAQAPAGPGSPPDQWRNAKGYWVLPDSGPTHRWAAVLRDYAAWAASFNSRPQTVTDAHRRIRALADSGFGPAAVVYAQRTAHAVLEARRVAEQTGKTFEQVLDSLQHKTKYGASGAEGLGPVTAATPFEWLDRAQAAGAAEAILQRAVWGWHGWFGPKLPIDSVRALLRSTLETDDPTTLTRAAHLAMGWRAWIGAQQQGLAAWPEDRALAAPLLLRAAGLGSTAALRLGAEICRVQRDLPCHRDAWLLSEQLAARGEPDGLVDVAEAFYYGQGAAKDTAIALAYLARAAEAGGYRAKLTLARWAEQGRAMPPNPAWANLMLDSLAPLYEPAREEVGVRYLFGIGRPRDEQRGAALLTGMVRYLDRNARHRYPRATYYAAWYLAMEAFGDTTSWTAARVDEAYQVALTASVLQKQNPRLLTGYDASALANELFLYKKAKERQIADRNAELRRQTIAANRAQWAAQLDQFTKNLGAVGGVAPSSGTTPTPYRLLAPETCARLAQVREATAARLGINAGSLGAGPCQ